MVKKGEFDGDVKSMYQIVGEIEKFVGIHGGTFPEYYIGITPEVTENKILLEY